MLYPHYFLLALSKQRQKRSYALSAAPSCFFAATHLPGHERERPAVLRIVLVRGYKLTCPLLVPLVF